MKNKEQFDKSIQLLVKAYFDGSLNAWDCTSCAVGNLVGHGSWTFKGDSVNTREIKIRPEKSNPTIYTPRELGKIEWAFTRAVNYMAFNRPVDEDNFNGLMNVVDVLQLIHGCTDKETEKAKLEFVA